MAVKSRGRPDFDPEVGRATRFQSGSKAAEAGRKGGKRNGETLRRRKTQKEQFEMLLACKPDLPEATKRTLKTLDIPADGDGKYTMGLIAAAAIMQKAMKGDTRAFDMMLGIVGERPADQAVLVVADTERQKAV